MGQWIRGRLGIGTHTNTGTPNAGNGGGGGGVSTPQLAGLNVTPTSINSSMVGEQIQINAAPVDQFGNLFQSPVTFQVLDQQVAIVSNGGLVTIEGNGATQVLVTAGAFSKTVNINVAIVAPVYHLAWTTKPSDLVFNSLGITGTPVAKLYDANGVLAANQPVITLAVTDQTVFSLSGSTLTSLKNGSSVITASAAGIPNLTDTATVNQIPTSITGLPATLATDNNSTGKFLPIVKDANSQVVTNVVPSFLSNNTNIIGVDSLGNWTTVGKSLGNTTVTVTAGTVSVTFNVAVSAVAAGGTPNLATGQYLMGSTGSAPMLFDDALKYTDDADWKAKAWGSVPCTNVNNAIVTRGNNIGVQGTGSGNIYTDGRNSFLARRVDSPTSTFKSNNFAPGFDEPTFEFMIEGANQTGESQTAEGFHYGLPAFMSGILVYERAFSSQFSTSGEAGPAGTQATGDAHIYNVGGTLSTGQVVPNQAPALKSSPFVMTSSGRDGYEGTFYYNSANPYLVVDMSAGESVPGVNLINFNAPPISDTTLWVIEARFERWLSPIDNLYHCAVELCCKKKGTTTWYRGQRYIGTFASGHGNIPYTAVDPIMKNYNQARALDAHLMIWQPRWAVWNADSNYDPMGSRAYFALQPAPAPSGHTFNSFNSGTGVYVGNVTIDYNTVKLRPYINGVATPSGDYTIPLDFQGRYATGSSSDTKPTIAVGVGGVAAGNSITWHAINGNGDVETTGSAAVIVPSVPNAPTIGNATAQTSNSLTFPVTLNAAGSLPTALAVRRSTDNATWTNLSDIPLSSPSLGQVLSEVLGGLAGTQIYYVQVAEKNTLGQSAWSASATGTTSTIVPVNHTSLNLNPAVPSVGVAPSTTKSAALPLARNTTSLTWGTLTTGTAGGLSNPYVFTNANGGPSSALLRAFASMPLVAATIPAMNYTFNYGIYSESGASYPYQLAPVLYVWRPGTSTVVGYIIDSATGVGSVSATNGTVGAGKVATVAGSAVTVQDGDILCFEQWFVTATAPNANYIHTQFGGDNAITEGADTNTFNKALIAFATAIAFQS